MWHAVQDLDFDRHFNSLYVARLSKGDEAALDKLSGTGSASEVQPLQSGEWDGEVSLPVRALVMIVCVPRVAVQATCMHSAA